MATPESLITGLLEAIAGWGGVAGRELGEALGNPSNVPIFLSSLVKFSLGPFLAFGLSFLAFRWQEKRKDQKVSESTRAMILLENIYNLKEMRKMEEEVSIKEAIIKGLTDTKPKDCTLFINRRIQDLRTFSDKERLRDSFFDKVDPSLLTQSFDHHELLLIYDLYNNVYPSLIEYIKDIVRSCESGYILDAIQGLEKAVSELEKTKIKREELEKEKTELEKLEDELSELRENIKESRANFNKIIKIMCETLEIDLKSDYEIDLILDSMLETFSDEESLSGYEIVGWMQDFSLKLRDGEIDLSKLRVVDSQSEEHVDPEESFLELQKVLSDYMALLLRSAEVYKQSVKLSLTMGTNRITKEIGDSREYISAICTVLAKNSTKEQRSVVEEYLE